MDKETLEEEGKRIKDETTYEKKIMTANQQLLDKKEKLIALLEHQRGMLATYQADVLDKELLIESLRKQIEAIENELE